MAYVFFSFYYICTCNVLLLLILIADSEGYSFVLIRRIVRNNVVEMVFRCRKVDNYFRKLFIYYMFLIMQIKCFIQIQCKFSVILSKNIKFIQIGSVCLQVY